LEPVGAALACRNQPFYQPILPVTSRSCDKDTFLMTARVPLAVAIIVLYLLHQDIWFWTVARPLVFGFLPIGLAYHAVYCLAAAALMWELTKTAWPAHLEKDPRR
jgi:hypothetical protein